jgi:uncharacterized membrane protein HdeD (DUF308 family)
MNEHSRFAVQEDQLEELQKHWVWFLVLGISLVVLGMLAIGHSVGATEFIVKVFGLILLVSGVVQVVVSFSSPKWSGLLAQFLFGILYAIVGMMVASQPDSAAAVITLLMAVFFIVGGIFRIVLALDLKFRNWGWALFHGIVTLMLGMMVWSSWPSSAPYVIGIFVGIEVLVSGWVWIMMAISVRSITEIAQGNGNS